MTNIWIAPASSENMNYSIYNKYKFQYDSEYKEEYMWAFNKTRIKSWNELKVGDVVIFGSNNKKGEGWTRKAIVKSKFEFKNDNDSWPFKSPSGTPWTYAFTLEKPVVIKITPSQMKDIIGHNGFQSQTKVKEEVRKKIDEIILN